MEWITSPDFHLEKAKRLKLESNGNTLIVSYLWLSHASCWGIISSLTRKSRTGLSLREYMITRKEKRKTNDRGYVKGATFVKRQTVHQGNGGARNDHGKRQRTKTQKLERTKCRTVVISSPLMQASQVVTEALRTPCTGVFFKPSAETIASVGSAEGIIGDEDASTSGSYG